MNPRLILTLVILIAVPGLPPLKAATKPNILVILLDDVGYGDFSCHGNPILKTPHIDRLHAESIRLTDFHVCPMCTPTRSQLMTGIDCLRNGAMNVSSGRTPLRRDVQTLAEMLRAQGYRTGHFGKWHLGDNYPYRAHDRGFQESISSRSWGIGSAAEAWNNDAMNDTYGHNDKTEVFPGYNTDVFFTEASRWITSSKDSGTPFFAYLALTAAHGPHFVPDRYKAPYATQKPNVASFFGMIANIDENLGKLEATLRESGLRDNTLLVFLTDNGGTAGVAVFNAGMRGGKTTLYEGGHRVPCFVRWPKGMLQAPSDVGELCQVQDMVPTLLDLAAVPPPAGTRFDGTTLAPLLRGEKTTLAERKLVVQYSRIQGGARPKKQDACILWKKWRMVGESELYDLAVDPGQKQNIHADHPDIVRQLAAHYETWWAGVEKGLDVFQPIPIGSEKAPRVVLSPCDWGDIHFDQSAQVRRGDKKIGGWHIQVETTGTYEITLRRWPRESGLTLSQASPEHKGELGRIPAGVALPIRRARVRVGDFDETYPVPEGAEAFTLNVPLKVGRTYLSTLFGDAEGNGLCSAYYVEVRRK